MEPAPLPLASQPLAESELRSGLRSLQSPAGMLEAIFLHAPVGLQMFSRDGRCVLVNPMHTRLFGAVPPPDYNIFEDTVLADRGVADLVRRAFAGEQIAIPPIWYDVRELRNVKVEGPGRRISVGAELVPLRAEQSGEISHVLIVFQDVTDTEQAREEAEAAAARSAFLADAGRLLSSSLNYEVTLARVARLATPTIADFCVVDLLEADGQVRRVAATHADRSMQPVLDELRRRYPPAPDSPQPAMRVVRSGEPELLSEVTLQDVAHQIEGPEHQDLLLRLGVRSYLAVPLALGQRILGCITLGYSGERRYGPGDLPLVEALATQAAVAIENARLYRKAERALADAEAANRAKDEFLAVLGHELRNPLAPIVTALEITRRRDGPSPERSIIERQVRHLRRLVDDLLDVSRITRGKLELDLQTIELRESVQQGVELARPLVEERAHTLRVDCPAQGLPVQADRARLAQVVANLLSNAARYTPKGGEVTLRAAREGDAVVVRVRDNGIGISPELLPRLFQPFTQGAQGVERHGGGLGLGLAIVRSLCEQHGGTVAAHSAGPGQGSEFEVRLPAAAAPPAEAPPQDGETDAAGTSSGYVLVVDDNRDAADLLAEALRMCGYEVAVAYHPRDALLLVRERAPDAAILDIGLPEMDGYQLAHQLRQDERLQATVLIALTGYGQESDRAAALQAGFGTHLTKPAPVDEVLRVLDEALARSP